MCIGKDESKMACKGAPTISRPGSNMVECQACGAEVAHDLAEHPFFGFAADCLMASMSTGSTN